MQDDELLKILKRCRKGGYREWSVEAMLNAFYAGKMLQIRLMVSLRRNLVVTGY